MVDRLRVSDPALVSVILTGSFGRGEGAARDGAPQNDYDVVAVRRLLPRPSTYGTLTREFEDTFGLHIDLVSIPQWYLRRAPQSIFWYETAHSSHVLWGDDVRTLLGPRPAESICPGEGYRLLANRAYGLLADTTYDDPASCHLQASKAILASVDACLLASGDFRPHQGRRVERWLASAERGDTTGPHRVDDEAIAWVRWAYGHKTRPADTPEPHPALAWNEARRALLRAFDIAARQGNVSASRSSASLDHVVHRLKARKHGLRAVAGPGPTDAWRALVLATLVKAQAPLRESDVSLPANPFLSEGMDLSAANQLPRLRATVRP